MMEYTFAMIKPDAIEAKNSGKIIDLIEKNGFDIMRMHKIQLTSEAAEEFYAVHKGKPFYKALTEFVCSSPVIIMVLGKENAIADWRKLMGATDPKNAEAGTVRALYGESIDHNAVHGSDAQETAEQELGMFFVDEEEDFDDADEDAEYEECDEESCEEDEECCK